MNRSMNKQSIKNGICCSALTRVLFCRANTTAAAGNYFLRSSLTSEALFKRRVCALIINEMSSEILFLISFMQQFPRKGNFCHILQCSREQQSMPQLFNSWEKISFEIDFLFHQMLENPNLTIYIKIYVILFVCLSNFFTHFPCSNFKSEHIFGILVAWQC